MRLQRAAARRGRGRRFALTAAGGWSMSSERHGLRRRSHPSRPPDARSENRRGGWAQEACRRLLRTRAAGGAVPLPRRCHERNLAAACLLVILAGSAAGAAGTAALPLPARVETHHTITIAGHRLDYDAFAETFALKDSKGATTAEIFTVSYVLAGAPGSRPVTFAFNGGPGAAAVFLHLGALGPRI